MRRIRCINIGRHHHQIGADLLDIPLDGEIHSLIGRWVKQTAVTKIEIGW